MIDSINTGNNIVDYSGIKGKTQEAKQGEFENALEKAIQEKDDQKLKKACSELETVFVNMMFKQMRNTIQKGDLFSGGTGEEMYEDMLYEKYAEESSKNNGIGIGDILYRQLSKDMKKEKKESEENNAE